MSSSNFAFEPFNYQTGCKHPPLLNFNFCPSSGHFRTQFPQIGLAKMCTSKTRLASFEVAVAVAKQRQKRAKTFSRLQMSGLEHFRPPFFKHTASFSPIRIWTVISQMGWKITVTLEGEKVSYDYNLPFSYFVNFDSCRKKYPGCDSNAWPFA